MNPLRNKLALVVTIAMIGLALSGCSNDKSAIIYNPNDQGAPTPEITAVDPSAAAVGGVTKMKITGKNFSPAVAENFVYFGTVAGTVLTASPAELTVLPPTLIADSLTLRVVVSKAFLAAKYARPYKLESISNPYGKFGSVNSLALDAQENLFASPPSAVVKLSPNGQTATYSTLIFVTASAMKFGSNGFLYAQRNRNIRLYRIAPGGGGAQEFFRFPSLVSYFDFDKNGNLYAGADGGLYVLNPNLTVKTTGKYQGISIKAIRVFNDYAYVAVAGSTAGILRNKILSADGNLGDDELFFDWTKSGAFAAFEIGDLTFAQDGDMYIVADRKESDPILVVHPDGKSETLYAGALKFPVFNFVWGNDQFLYVNHNTAAGVSRVAMGKKGAPYFGR